MSTEKEQWKEFKRLLEDYKPEEPKIIIYVGSQEMIDKCNEIFTNHKIKK